MIQPTKFLWDNLLQAIQIQTEIVEYLECDDTTFDNTTVEYYRTLLNQCMKFLGAISSSENDNDNHCNVHSTLDHHWSNTWNELLNRFQDIHLQTTTTTRNAKLLRQQLNELFKSTKKASAEYTCLVAIQVGSFDSSCTVSHVQNSQENPLVSTQRACLLLEKGLRHRIVQFIQHSMLYGVPLPTQGELEQQTSCGSSNLKPASSKVLSQSESIMACIYACFILHDLEMKIEAESILSILKAANIEIPGVYATIVSTYLGKDNQTLLKKVLELNSGSFGQVAQSGSSNSNDIVIHEEKYGIPSQQSDEEFDFAFF
ncbi:hypothetical protein FDP41_007735 [Naegleria fowleri]|uniref:Uncharacterized protein n=1 Tax=Naegleria fowleri TaxID=5763 RepID=A0A6A5CE24_NAEFO|nr:uncharacterized protein FDP41_007735 [Naegleria fowleri]KAF0983820.1 hypothetical protein FDP41_007735 [Naegleria fowleri]CAG4716948.1 unnamed protein product [Naegleria fowleri]